MTRKRRATPRVTASDRMAWWHLWQHREFGTLEPALDVDLEGLAEVYQRDRRRFVAKYRSERKRLGAGRNGNTATPVAFFETDDLELRDQARADLFAHDEHRRQWRLDTADLFQ